MPGREIDRSFGIAGQPVLDRWLRFNPAIDARYDAEHALRRRADLQFSIYFGLLIYNVYNLTSIVLLSDIVWLSLVVRICLVSPISLALAWSVGRVPPRWGERLVLGGVLNAFFVPVGLFWLTADRRGVFTFGELFLVVVYANLVLALRFRDAAVFTAGALGATLVAVFSKAGLDATLRFAFTVQIVTACAFSLYANYRTERRRCEDYLVVLGATLKAQSSDVARQQFQDLSRTDALTGLPNRRYLAERLDQWLAETGSVAVMMIDIDHFKLYNDALGHPAGDDCLRRVSQVFAAVGQTADAFCARFGGEEFTCVMRGTTELEAARLAKGLLRAIEALAIPHPTRSDAIGIVTVSVGVALKPEGAAGSQADVLAVADRALYLAKSLGRNRMEMAREIGTGRLSGISA